MNTRQKRLLETKLSVDEAVGPADFATKLSDFFEFWKKEYPRYKAFSAKSRGTAAAETVKILEPLDAEIKKVAPWFPADSPFRL